jgi:hypothetical protein
MSSRKAVLCGFAALASAFVTPCQAKDLIYTAVSPCRVIDTRGPNQPLLPNVTRGFLFRGATTNYGAQGGNTAGCGIPGLTTDGGDEQNAAKAVAINIVAVGATGAGHLVAWPANQAAPVASVINYAANASLAGLNIANGVIVPMCDQVAPTPCTTGDISFLAAVSPTHLVVDVVGYFTTSGRPGAVRHGTGADADSALCASPISGVRFGLSAIAVEWAGAAAACPAGTWVCSVAERGSGTCDTSRLDGACDGMNCSGDCFNFATNGHLGWVADAFTDLPDGTSEACAASPSCRAQALGEQIGEGGLPQFACLSLPVWCCSR